MGRSRRRSSRCPRYTTVGGKTIKNVQSRLRDVRQAQRRGRQRDLRPAFLHGHVTRGGQVQADRRRARLLGSDHRRRASARHRQVFRHQRGRAHQPEHQGPERHDDGPGERSIPIPASRMGCRFPVVSYRDSVRVHKALRRFARGEEAAGGGGRIGGLDPGDGMGAHYTRISCERVVHVIGPGFDISPYVIEMLDVWVAADQARPEMERRRLLRQGRTGRRRRAIAEDRHDHRARARLGGEDVRLQMGRSGEGSGRAMSNTVRDRGHARQGRRRAREDDRRAIR